MPPRLAESDSLAGGEPIATPTGTKRSASGKAKVKKYYAVQTGKVPGVYEVWADCQEQITGHKGAVFKSFMSHEDAQRFVNGEDTSGAPAPPSKKKKTGKYYGVAAGHNPGVYTDWADAQVQIDKFKGPKYKKFTTEAEALAFVESNGTQGASEKGPGRPRTVTTTGPNIKHVKPRKQDKTKTAIEPNDELASPDEAEPDTIEADRPLAKRPKQTRAAPVPKGTKLPRVPKSAKVEASPELGSEPEPQDPGPEPEPELEPVPESEDEDVANQEDSMDPVEPEDEGDLEDPANIKIYTDGSSLRNGQTGAKAGVGVYFGPNDSRNVSERLTGEAQTNQRAELTAVLRALEIAPLDREVTIYTDSKYSIDCCSKWYLGWEKNNWMTSQGKPVTNKDLIESILEKIRERLAHNVSSKTNFEWVKGHSVDKRNAAADRLAVAGANMRSE